MTKGKGESRDYVVIHATKYCKGDKNEPQMRLVVLEFRPKEPWGGYAIRYQTKDGATFGGMAFNSKQEAYDVFVQEFARHNSIFRKGNPSHLPGIVK